MDGLTGLVRGFGDLDVTVVGDALLDRWASGETRRLCREAPVPVVSVTGTEDRPGGAGNTAANVAALGARAHLVAALGGDEPGAALRAALAAGGVVGHLVDVPGRRTPVKQRFRVGGQILLRVDDVDGAPLPPAAERELLDALAGAPGRVLLAADYGLGVLTAAVRQRLAAQRDRVLVVDSHDLLAWRSVRPVAVTPNWAEARALLGPGAGDVTGPERVDVVERGRDRLWAATGARLVVVTLDADGAVLLERGRPPYRAYARPVPEHRTIGAGDSFAAAFTLALAAGAEPPEAVEVGSAAAAAVVAGVGTVVCRAGDLLAHLGRAQPRLLDAAQLAATVAGHRAAGQRIVFTNGCFDVLHRGHVAYLDQAKRLGDVLVVAVNSDRSVAALKGPDRPVIPLEDRAAVLAALSCVDYLIAFDEPSPVRLLEQVRPDVYVKGGDYTPEMIPEASVVRRLGGQVRVVDYLADRSTSAVLERIRSGGPVETTSDQGT